MQIIDVDSHITVVKGLEDTSFQIRILPDGGHLMEFNRTQLDFTPPQGKMLRPGKPSIDMRTWWDLDRRLEDLDQEGIGKQVLIFHTSHWAVESEDSLIPEAVKRWGAERILFSTDYPHPDTPWPESVKELREKLASTTAEDQSNVLGGNAARLFHL